jgi:hypothetical protein
MRSKLKKLYPKNKVLLLLILLRATDPGDLQRVPLEVFILVYIFIFASDGMSTLHETLLFVYLFISMCPIFIVTTTVTRFPSI